MNARDQLINLLYGEDPSPTGEREGDVDVILEKHKRELGQEIRATLDYCDDPGTGSEGMRCCGVAEVINLLDPAPLPSARDMLIELFENGGPDTGSVRAEVDSALVFYAHELAEQQREWANRVITQDCMDAWGDDLIGLIDPEVG